MFVEIVFVEAWSSNWTWEGHVYVCWKETCKTNFDWRGHKYICPPNLQPKSGDKCICFSSTNESRGHVPPHIHTGVAVEAGLGLDFSDLGWSRCLESSIHIVLQASVQGLSRHRIYGTWLYNPDTRPSRTNWTPMIQYNFNKDKIPISTNKIHGCSSYLRPY